MYKNILFPIDIADENSWLSAVKVVTGYAAAFSAKVNVMTVVPDLGITMLSDYFPKNTEEKMLKEMGDRLEGFVARNFPKELEVKCLIRRGAVYEQVIETAKKVKADLIVMAAHRPELKDYLLGPNAAKVVRHSNISVLVVREG